MYTIKQIPEDFIVEEVFKFEDNKESNKEGEYLYVLVKKKKKSTPEVIKILSSSLKVLHKNIGVGGNKDKKAITTQVISLKGVSEERVKNLKLNDIELSVLGKSETPIYLGWHESNKFIITIRNLDGKEYKKITNKIKNKTIITFINFFGEQRFGKNNLEIGLAIMKEDFEKACNLIDDKNIEEYFIKNPSNYVGALTSLPKRTITLYIHSVQSHLWNVLAEKFKESKRIPIPGYMAEYPSKEMKSFVENTLAKYNLTSRDFIIRKVPNLFTGGGERSREVFASDVEIVNKGKDRKEKDELNEGKKKITISFTLPKGSYATVFVESLFE